MHVAAVLLADSRFPGGGHVHSGGLEEAAARGLVTGIDDLRPFLVGRLRTAGELAAVFAAVSARRCTDATWWATMDAELDARTPSTAQRMASRAQGKATLRAGCRAWPSPVLDALTAAAPRPHHPVVLGALTALAGGGPQDAALAAGYLAVSGPASAAVRLLGLDPLAVNALLAELGERLTEQAELAAQHATDDPADLPAPAAPGLDVLAEAQVRNHAREVRLFVS